MKKYKNSQKLIVILFIIILGLGIYFRVTNLDKKIFWHDEVYTKLYMSGYGKQDWQKSVFNGQIIAVEDIQKYLQFNPRTTIRDTINILAIEEPDYTPIYHICARFWVQWFGDSIVGIRSFSVVSSLLIFPALYWLCWELFNSSIVAGTTLAIMSVSPFFILYAQEARDFTLWTALILFANALLLRSIRLEKNPNVPNQNKKYAWVTYGILLTLSFYTSLFTVPVILANSIYLICIEKNRITKTLVSYIIVSLVTGIAFLPWIIVFIINYRAFDETMSWVIKTNISNLELLKNLGLNISRVFFDFGLEFDQPLTYIIYLVSLTLVIYSLYWVYRNTPPRIYYFIFSLSLVPIAFLLLPDLILGGIRSVSARYLIASFLGFILAVSYLMATKIIQPIFLNLFIPKILSILAAILISISIISCLINSQAQAVWFQVISYNLPQVAQIINQSPSPLLIGNQTGYHPGNIFALSYLLKPEVKVQVLGEKKTDIISTGFTNIFLLNPSDELKAGLEKNQNINIRPIFSDAYLSLLKVNLQEKSSQQL